MPRDSPVRPVRHARLVRNARPVRLRMHVGSAILFFLSCSLRYLAPIHSAEAAAADSDGGDSRIVAFVSNSGPCPSRAQLAQYTHILVSFAVTYTWHSEDYDGRECHTDENGKCAITSPVAVCENEVKQDLVDAWRSAGKKVILSFGGALMGGTWFPDPNGCWDTCAGHGASVVQELTAIVKEQNFDGVDIDYEYFLDTQERRDFLTDITVGLKNSLPEGQNIVTHAPMDAHTETGMDYHTILKENAQYIDFIMPMYYNSWINPVEGLVSSGALAHYDDLVNGIFDGQAHRVVFGFCLSECGGFNANGQQAAQIMRDLKTWYPCNGGAFLWAASDDGEDADWSTQVAAEVFQASGCSSSGSAGEEPIVSSPPPPEPITSPPSPMPIASPTTNLPSPAPTQQPSPMLTDSYDEGSVLPTPSPTETPPPTSPSDLDSTTPEPTLSFLEWDLGIPSDGGPAPTPEPSSLLDTLTIWDPDNQSADESRTASSASTLRWFSFVDRILIISPIILAVILR